MKRKSTKTALLMSFTSLLLCCAMLIGTTFAWFTDSVTSGVNRIVAGNLDIEVRHTNETDTDEEVGINTTLFDKVTLWEPGAVEYENITVKNVGNLAAKVKLNVTDVAKNKMVDGDYDLTQVIKVAVKENGFTGTVTRDSITADDSLTWTDFQTFAKDFTLAGKSGETVDSKTYGIALYWQPTENDNKWNLNNGKASSDGQPLWINFGLNVVATQNTVEVDSFDEKYDKQATFPALAAVVNDTESYSGNFTQNKNVSGGTTDSTQVTAKEDIKLPGNDAVTLIPAGTTLFMADGSSDVAIITSNDNAEGYAGSIVSNIKTTESTSASVTYQISYKYVEGDSETSVSKFSNIVTNVFDVSAGLKNVKVSTVHNGGAETELTKVNDKPATPTDKTFYYDSVNGKLYIYSSEYSDFKVTYDYDFVAAVAGQGYSTLTKAVDAAKTGETIIVLKDCESTGLIIFPEGKNLTLDLNGKNVNTVGNEKGKWAEVKGELTVIGDGYLGDSTHNATGYTFMVFGTLNLNSSAKFESGLEVAQMQADGAKLYISDGYFIGDEWKGVYWTFNKLDKYADTSSIEITGGSFEDFDPAGVSTESPHQNWVKDGYFAIKNGNVWTVNDGVAQNVQTGEKYGSLADAISAAQSGQTIKMLCDTEYTDVGFKLENVNLDLNGYKMKFTRGEGKPRSFDVYGNVTISNGSIETSLFTDSYGAIYANQDSNATLNNVNVKAYKTSDPSIPAYGAAVFGGYMDDPNGNMVINGGVFDSIITTNGSTRGGSLTINDGKFNEELYLPAYMTYTINGGTFEKCVEFDSGIINITGGTFNYAGDYELWYSNTESVSANGCSIALLGYNGQLDNSHDSGYGPTPVLNVTGGTFTGKIGLARENAEFAYPSVTAPNTVQKVELGVNAQ